MKLSSRAFNIFGIINFTLAVILVCLAILNYAFEIVIIDTQITLGVFIVWLFIYALYKYFERQNEKEIREDEKEEWRNK